jgi:hypothetical protein
MKAATKRRARSESHVLDRASMNLLRALKQDRVRKEGRVDYEQLRQDGYSERLLAPHGRSVRISRFSASA